MWFFAVSIFASLLLMFYFFLKWRLSYWKRRGVVQIEPEFIDGNTKDVNKKTAHSCVVYQKFYEHFKKNGHKFGGIYDKLTPVLIPTDLELIKSILQTDFSHFVNHDIYINEEGDALSGNLFNLRDEKWRNIRAKLTPTFTTGKLKMMFQTLIETTSGLEELLNKQAASKDPVDIKDILTSFTIEIITSVAFGIDSNSITNPNSEFRAIANTLLGPSKEQRKPLNIFTELRRSIRIFGDLIPEWVLLKMNVRLIPQFLEDFFTKVVTDIVQYREENNIYRKDFMHLLIQLKNMGKVTDDRTLTTNSSKQSHLTLKEVAAHSFVFFIAGFETSSTAMTYALLHLAKNQEIQDKLREEINSGLEIHNGHVTYDFIMEMQYMEQVLLESLRMHAPIELIKRFCNKEYKIPNSDVVIEKGTKMYIPVFGIHNDPDYYPNPEVFDPDRFSPENKHKIPTMAYLPFGEGPRLCIGLRFGKLQAKVGLYSILRNFKVTLSEKTHLPLKYDGIMHFPNVQGGVWLNLEPLVQNGDNKLLHWLQSNVLKTFKI